MIKIKNFVFNKNSNNLYEKSCGGIIFRKESEKIEYLIVKHRKRFGNHWEFPKGGVEDNETEKETAKREIFEEVKLKVDFVDNFREEVNYITNWNSANKTVVFFLCRYKSGKVTHILNEIDNHKWLEFDDAIKLVTRERAKKILVKANEFLLKTCH